MSLCSYSWCFGEDIGGEGILGNPKTYGMYKNAAVAGDAGGIPKLLDVTFQGMFAIIT